MAKAVKMQSRISAQEKKWQAESDLRTLQSASEIRNDSSRISAAVKVAKQQVAALSSVVGKPAASNKPVAKPKAK